jgi:hypothetical protein
MEHEYGAAYSPLVMVLLTQRAKPLTPSPTHSTRLGLKRRRKVRRVVFDTLALHLLAAHEPRMKQHG